MKKYFYLIVLIVSFKIQAFPQSVMTNFVRKFDGLEVDALNRRVNILLKKNKILQHATDYKQYHIYEIISVH